jgi:hypothetical protein
VGRDGRHSAAAHGFRFSAEAFDRHDEPVGDVGFTHERCRSDERNAEEEELSHALAIGRMCGAWDPRFA